jgi:hypothetical protein
MGFYIRDNATPTRIRTPQKHCRITDIHHHNTDGTQSQPGAAQSISEYQNCTSFRVGSLTSELSTRPSRICRSSSPVLPCASRESAIERDIIRKEKCKCVCAGQSIFNDPSAQWVSDAYRATSRGLS